MRLVKQRLKQVGTFPIGEVFSCSFVTTFTTITTFSIGPESHNIVFLRTEISIKLNVEASVTATICLTTLNNSRVKSECKEQAMFKL